MHIRPYEVQRRQGDEIARLDGSFFARWRIRSIGTKSCNTTRRRHGIHASMMDKRSDKDVLTDLQDAVKAVTRRMAPASGCFGFTRANLAERRQCEMDAELFARFYSEPCVAPAAAVRTHPRKAR